MYVALCQLTYSSCCNEMIVWLRSSHRHCYIYWLLRVMSYVWLFMLPYMVFVLTIIPNMEIYRSHNAIVNNPWLFTLSIAKQLLCISCLVIMYKEVNLHNPVARMFVSGALSIVAIYMFPTGCRGVVSPVCCTGTLWSVMSFRTLLLFCGCL